MRGSRTAVFNDDILRLLRGGSCGDLALDAEFGERRIVVVEVGRGGTAEPCADSRGPSQRLTRDLSAVRTFFSA
jgi:hypothetical protein